MAVWMDDVDGDDAPMPWALRADEPDPVEDWGEEDDETDPWLDEQLAELRPRSRSQPDPALSADPFERGGVGGMALRRPAPDRVPRRRQADLDVVGDLPGLSVPGYVRDRRGTWRYAATGGTVPGARDLTLRSLHRFTIGRGHVLVPVDLVRTEAELAWCMAWKHTLTTRVSGGRSVAVLRVPVGEWERRADVPFGLWAPELAVSRLLDISEVARLVGVSSATITAYLSRGRMPEPVMRLGRLPVWSRPIIRQWLAARPGQGRRTVG